MGHVGGKEVELSLLDVLSSFSSGVFLSMKIGARISRVLFLGRHSSSMVASCRVYKGKAMELRIFASSVGGIEVTSSNGVVFKSGVRVFKGSASEMIAGSMELPPNPLFFHEIFVGDHAMAAGVDVSSI